MILNKPIVRLSIAILLGMSMAAGSVNATEMTKPETVGFSSERLHRLEQAMQDKIDHKELAGAVTLLARHGKVVSLTTYGQQDIASASAMKKDAIFRIFSMTKPITSVAMMILYEEGKWQPSDPIEKFIPELKNIKVVAGQNKDGTLLLEEAKHAPTMGELMTHTAGFSYGFLDSPVSKLYTESNLFASTSLEEFIRKIVKLPLAYQPGEHWEYSVSADVQGYLIEHLSGMPLSQFIEERIFQPLGMVDTSFAVPETKRSRLATSYQPDTNGVLTPMWNDTKKSSAPVMSSGGGGLYSTAEDYLRFAQMLLNEGSLANKKILSPSSVKLMRSNHLPEKLRNGKFGIGPYHMQAGLGFGYNLGVLDDPLKVDSTVGAGTYFWIGAAGTWFWVDPTNDLIFIGMTQRWMLAPGMPELENMSRTLVYQALLEPKK